MLPVTNKNKTVSADRIRRQITPPDLCLRFVALKLPADKSRCLVRHVQPTEQMSNKYRALHIELHVQVRLHKC